MSQWEQWFKGFIKNWFYSLAERLNKFDEDTRTQFEAALSKFESKEIEGFTDSWSDLNNPKSVKEQVGIVLDLIEEPSKEQLTSLKDWFSILMATIEQQQEDVRAQILSLCGETCAIWATDTFKKIWSDSDNLKEFLQKMNTQMCEGDNVYRYVNENTVEIAYPKCLCPIVGFDLISSPMLCNCSSSWLKTNFEATFGKHVDVKRINTVLNGSSSCSFMVRLN